MGISIDYSADSIISAIRVRPQLTADVIIFLLHFSIFRNKNLRITEQRCSAKKKREYFYSPANDEVR